MTEPARICEACRKRPTLVPALSVCRQCLAARVDQDRANARAHQELARERVRQGTRRPAEDGNAR